MQPPELEDFIALFECEPVLLDPSVAWKHNTLTFRTERGAYSVWFEISPSYSSLKASIALGGREIARAEITDFDDLEIMTERGRELLIVRFYDRGNLYLTLKPEVGLRTAI